MSLLKPGDIIIVFFIILAIGLSFFTVSSFKGNDVSSVAVIKQGDKIIKTIQIDKVKHKQEVNINGKFHIIILMENGRIRFEEADCPDKVCVKTGWLSKSGQIAVCVPGQIIIKIEGYESKVDTIAGWK